LHADNAVRLLDAAPDIRGGFSRRDIRAGFSHVGGQRPLRAASPDPIYPGSIASHALELLLDSYCKVVGNQPAFGDIFAEQVLQLRQ
jgi:hypothetical protein